MSTCLQVTFPVENEPNTEFLAWTTTPWTLPSNLALCVRADMDYIKVKDKETGKAYIFAKSRVDTVYRPGHHKVYVCAERVMFRIGSQNLTLHMTGCRGDDHQHGSASGGASTGGLHEQASAKDKKKAAKDEKKKQKEQEDKKAAGDANAGAAAAPLSAEDKKKSDAAKAAEQRALKNKQKEEQKQATLRAKAEKEAAAAAAASAKTEDNSAGAADKEKAAPVTDIRNHPKFELLAEMKGSQLEGTVSQCSHAGYMLPYCYAHGNMAITQACAISLCSATSST